MCDNPNKLNILQKGNAEIEDKEFLERVPFKEEKKLISKICKGLNKNSENYSFDETVGQIKNYITINSVFLHSEINNYFINLEDSDKTIFLSNLDKLINYVNDTEVDIEIVYIITNIYDNCNQLSHLIVYEKNNIEQLLSSGINKSKFDFNKQVKDIEKNYITILGIFAAIVLTFVSGLTFSNSVLQNIDAISIYRLAFVIDLLAFVLINVIYMLLVFILKINDREIKQSNNIYIFNTVCLIIPGIIWLLWLFN